MIEKGLLLRTTNQYLIFYKFTKKTDKQGFISEFPGLMGKF